MSSADDVYEMKGYVNEIADRLVGVRAKIAARAGVVMKAIGGGTSENRAFEFLKGRARKVEAWEKENAKRQRDALRRREQIEQENQHLAWLECELGRLRASGEEFHGPHVDALVDLLRGARGEAGAVAVSQAAEGEG